LYGVLKCDGVDFWQLQTDVPEKPDEFKFSLEDGGRIFSRKFVTL
jgi:hypothetical protein